MHKFFVGRRLAEGTLGHLGKGVLQVLGIFALLATIFHPGVIVTSAEYKGIKLIDGRGFLKQIVPKLGRTILTPERDPEGMFLAVLGYPAIATVQAQSATQRALWGGLSVLSLVLVGVAMLGWRAWRSRRELTDLALRDELTSLPNRRAIEAYARAQLSQSQRLGLPFTIALLDLDHFKQVNDRFGHPAGDALLQALARVVPQVLRAPDRLGRWGGEEFMLVLPGTRGDEIGGVFARLLSAFATVDATGLPSPHGVTFSMGGVEAGPAVGFDALVAAADERLYAAKDAGRATWR